MSDRPSGSNHSDHFLTVETLIFPAGTGRATPTIAAPAGFEILGEVGRGGIGVVYRAWDLTLDREVALKFLQEGFSAESHIGMRFLEEAKITGQLQHPGIPPVYQVGSLTDGRPYLAMKLIRGQTFADLMAHGSGGEGKLTNGLAVFEGVCQAVGYAHGHNVIHRDLKPQNIMVGSFGEVQVMDWGLAKVLTPARPGRVPLCGSDRSAFPKDDSPPSPEDWSTHVGSVMGTPAFMPPEQAGGKIDRIDQRADVFALGAILCVILTGKPPYCGKDGETVRSAAIFGKTADAFARLDICGADPGLVALAKRCLAVEPLDRLADAREIAEEVAGLRADAEHRARMAELDLVRAEVRATEQWKRRKMQLALASSLGVVVCLLGGGMWWADHQSSHRRNEDARNHQAIDVALERADSAIRKENPVHGEIDASLAQVEHWLASTEDEPIRIRFESLKRDRRMLERLDDVDNRRWMLGIDGQEPDTRYAIENYPNIFREYGIDPDRETAEILAQKIRASSIAPRLMTALADWQALGDGDRLLALVNRLDPDGDRQAIRTAYAHHEIAGIVERLESLDGSSVPAAFAMFIGSHESTPKDRAVRILKQAQTSHPNHFGLALTIVVRLDFEQALEEKIFYCRIALAIRPTNALGQNNFGASLYYKHDLDGAVAAFRKAVQYDPHYAFAYNNLGLVLMEKNDGDGAMAAYREAIHLDPEFAAAHNNLGNALRDSKATSAAVAEYREAIRLDPQFVAAYNNLGLALYDLRNFNGAIAEYRKAIRLDPQLAWTHNNLGLALRENNDPDGAIGACRKAIRLDPDYALAHNNLGVALQDKKDFVGAVKEYREAIRLEPTYAPAYYNLGNALRDSQNRTEAIAAYRAAVRLDCRCAAGYYNLGTVLQPTDLDGAIQAYREAIRIDPCLAAAHSNLANALASKEDTNGAIEEYRIAVGLRIQWASTYTALAELLSQQNDPAQALQVIRDGAELNPDWMTELDTNFRYDAACYAVLACCSRHPAASERAELRREAFDWLTAELEARRRQLTDPNAKPLVYRKLTEWWEDIDLDGIRAAKQLEKLPDEERNAWRSLWSEVRELRERAAPDREVGPQPREVE